MSKTVSWQHRSALICIIMMIAGLFFSRALCAIAIGAFTVFMLSTISSGNTLRLYFSEPYNILLLLLLLIPLISGLWSSDVIEWWRRCVVKLPFLLLPIAFSLFKLRSRKEHITISAFYITCILAGSIWSISMYAADTSAIHDSYLKAKVIPTWFEDDHVRFSWAVVIALLLLPDLELSTFKLEFRRLISIVRIVLGIWLVVFLHILAAKTGLICLYLSVFLIIIFKIKTLKYKLAAITSLLVIPILAYYLVPTFHNRIDYIIYDFRVYSSGVHVGGFPDGARVLSIIGGLSIFSEHFFTGIGYGDVWPVMQEWYNVYYPSIPMHDRLFPSNQWLIYGCAAGVAAVIIFTAAVLVPFFITKYNRNVSYLSFHATALICFLTEMNLEGQHGVFLYCFFAMWLIQKEKASIPS